ncbi:MAG TPA: prenyltransferase, partial [Acidimicrobiia bacterium]|nr:prenyltransferase [Acidimicrobiia bacterium]
MADAALPPAATGPGTSRGARWRAVLRTGNPPPGAVDPITRWLVLTRAAVLPMTLTSVTIAGLLAWGEPGFSAGWWGLAAAGLVVAHMANNLMNDLFDLEVGTDTADYPRALYAPHPVLSGLISRRGLARAVLGLNLIDAGVLAVLVAA